MLNASEPRTFRVRYRQPVAGHVPTPADVQSIDLAVPLEQVPSQLPPDAYIMYIDDLTVGEAVHWTRWPRAYRPGFGG